MNEVQTQTISPKERTENVFAGVVGAFLFALAGGAVWYLFYQVGFLAGISGIIGIAAAVRGYTLFAGRKSIRGIAVAIGMTVLVLVAAQYFCLTTDVYQAHLHFHETGGIDYRLTYGEALAFSYTYLYDAEIAIDYLKDLAVGLLICAAASVAVVRGHIKSVRETAETETLPTAPTETE